MLNEPLTLPITKELLLYLKTSLKGKRNLILKATRLKVCLRM